MNPNILGRSMPSLSSPDKSNPITGDSSSGQTLANDISKSPTVERVNSCENKSQKSPPVVNKVIFPLPHSPGASTNELLASEDLAVNTYIRDCMNELLEKVLEYCEAIDSASHMTHPEKVEAVSHPENIPFQDAYVEITECRPEQCTEPLETAAVVAGEEVIVPELFPVKSTISKYQFEGDIPMITGAWSDFSKSSEDCFTKGCKWAPDGTCILTNSDDNILRIFDVPRDLHCQDTWLLGRTLPEMEPSLRIRAGEQVYDYCWYPLMSSNAPLSCCLATACQNCPIHLWDAYTGKIRCTYRPYNDVDEVEYAYSVAFSQCGDKLYCGFKKKVRVFDTCNPGRDCSTRNLAGSGRVINIVSTICVNPAVEKLYAVGSYSKTIALCAEPDGKVLCLFCGHQGAVTHLSFSPDGTKLYAGLRKDSHIICWDMRNMGKVLYTLEREVNNHQRIYFDISSDGRYVMSGGTNGKVKVWDTLLPPVSVDTGNPILPQFNKFQASEDSVNGISLHQQYPILATSSGQRHIEEEGEGSDDDVIVGPSIKKARMQRENCLKLWWLGRISLGAQ